MHGIVSKAAGKMKGVRARLDGLVGVFKTLVEQHAEISVSLKKLQAHPEKRAQMWPGIRRHLVSHENAEVTEVFTVLRAHRETAEIADHHDDQAGELGQMIDDLDHADRNNWPALFDELVETVIDHAAEEENEIFPKAQRVIGDQMAKRLDAKFLAVQKRFASAH
jgi:hemerythrin superfamily protein